MTEPTSQRVPSAYILPILKRSSLLRGYASSPHVEREVLAQFFLFSLRSHDVPVLGVAKKDTADFITDRSTLVHLSKKTPPPSIQRPPPSFPSQLTVLPRVWAAECRFTGPWMRGFLKKFSGLLFYRRAMRKRLENGQKNDQAKRLCRRELLGGKSQEDTTRLSLFAATVDPSAAQGRFRICARGLLIFAVSGECTHSSFVARACLFFYEDCQKGIGKEGTPKLLQAAACSEDTSDG